MEEAKWLVQDLPERGIVASIGEGSRGNFEALALEVVDKELLSDFRTRRSSNSMRTPVGIGNAKETLGHHVVVEVDEQIVDLVRCKVGTVVFAAQKAIFFGPPPSKSNLVLGLVL